MFNQMMTVGRLQKPIRSTKQTFINGIPRLVTTVKAYNPITTFVLVLIVSSATTTPTSTGTAVVTPMPVQPGIVPFCDDFYFVQPGDECETLAKSYEIALGDFYTWKPEVKNDCGRLQANVYVCVGVGSSNITPSPGKSTGSAVSTPTPTQAGMTDSCGSFYYVKPKDGCWEIAHSYSIELQDFYSWNPAVGNNCQGLQANVYACVGPLA
ncbi:hypothetical protein BDV30DRAFT_235027 [Aspergillus minisclerotigenes]|uniref:LysM domain-containing protein n=1 Tax=Aspergillus minisclerotigenes TaxID=656917 RepID=A0A5N6JFZ4_9EURO|nr:hypothetical protein BDV30DRAFT_235027 [Aspergillus minisclerotigenes]